MRDADFYDRVYFDAPGKSNYARYTVESSPFALHADAIVALLDRYGLDGPVLDVGCAKGYLVYVLRQRGVEAYGVDWSEYAIGSAGPDVQRFLQRASATDLPFPDGRFALAVTFDVLEHLDGAMAGLALVECARVSTYQLHQVNTGRLAEWGFDSDESHCLKRSLAEWRTVVSGLGLATTVVREPETGARSSCTCAEQPT